ncbi:MAG: SPOR domain-containing protein [Hylemonella sp.]|nr:SPOR domain-containing protein [Hylemonella sp.]MDP1937336.1 SPOR domain-containing protein [Hylemonella sp.]
MRLLVLALVLLNGLYYAWSHDLLRDYGFAPARQSEPQRLAQQIRPEAIRILSPDEVRQAEPVASVATKAPECLQVGLFDEAQVPTLRKALEDALPAGSWLLDAAIEPARWIVYMGRYPNAEILARKRAELASLNLRFEPLINPELEPGLSLGGFTTQDAANEALAALSRRGVRTARVVQERAEVRGSLLKIPAADEALRLRLDEVKPVLAGKPLRNCK